MPRSAPALVSVIVPVLDAETHFAEQLEALSAQTHAGRWELVVADNGCRDRSIEIARRHEASLPSLTIVDASARKGINHARNAGARAARGDFLAFCDADDVASPQWLAALAAAAPEGDLVAGRLDFDSLNGEAARRLCPWEPPYGLMSEYGFLPYVPGGNCGVWTDLARATGWDERFRFGSSDIDFSWRAQLAGARVGYAPGAVMRVRLKTSLRALVRQYHAYGRSDRLLHARFRALGLDDPPAALGVRHWPALARDALDVLGPPERRARWARHCARRCGHLSAPGRPPRRRATRAARPARLRLLEVGLRWPPETFLQRKFVSLAAGGIDVTVASTVPRRKARATLPGVRLQRVPSWAEPRAVKLVGAVFDALSLLAHDPRRLRKLVEVTRRPRPPSTAKTPWGETVGLLRQFLRLAHLRPDVVHFEWPTAAVHHIALADVWDCPVVISCRGSLHEFAHSPANGRFVPGLPLAFARAAAVHCVCDALIDEGPRFGIDRLKTWRITPAVDVELFRPVGRAAAGGGPLHVVSIARLSWTKGHEFALQAIRLLLDRGVAVRLEIIGDGPAHDRIEGALRDLELDERVMLHGRLAPIGIRHRLQDADVLLQPSVREGLPNTVLEAMACALPVVVADCGGAREAVTDGREGFVVPVRDPGAIADALEKLSRDPGLRTRMGVAGRARVEREFTLEEQTERTIELYEAVTGRGGGGA